MVRNRIGLVCGGAVLAAVVAGCDAPVSGEATEPAVPTFTSSAAAAPPPASSSAPPTVTVPPTSSAAPPAPVAPPPAAAAPAECKVGDLEVTLGRTEGTAGTVYRALLFTNAGGRTCTIRGFPGVSFVAGDDGHQVGQAAFRVGTKGQAITLTPGTTASAPVGFTQVRNFDPGQCRPTAVRGLRVYPPHEFASEFVPFETTGCAGTTPSHQLTVKTVRRGTGF